jgi:feruloyl esterase
MSSKATLAIGAAVGVILAGCNPQSPPEPQSRSDATAGQARSCASLTSLSVPNTTITRAESVAAGAFTPPSPPPFPVPGIDYSGLPEFCRVAGTIQPTPQSEIGFEVWLPAQNWNGKLMGVGNGGASGAIFHFAMVDPLRRGYAVANTDTGHRGPGGDMSFATEREKLVDFQHRGVHEMTVAAKAVVAARYGDSAERSYWNGCSTGGRQGLKEVQRYPDDYDGVIAGAPANHMTGLTAFSIHVQRELTDPQSPLPIAKLPLLKEAAIALCDAQDGVTDRVIGDPAACELDPASLQCRGSDTSMCLTPPEVEAARAIYRGVVNARTGEQVFPGTKPGGETGWAAFGSPEFAIGTSHFRYTVANDPSWDPFTFDYDADLARIAAADGGAGAAMDPSIAPFVSRGGKLLLYHGWTDGLISPGNTIDYYNSVVETIGADAADDGVRLFMLPGVDHCQGGEGAFLVDYVAALESWVENGVAPERLPASRPPGENAFTRRVCAYPAEPQWSGSGDPADGANWWCAGAE